MKLLLAFYLFLFPRCELMVSWLHDADFAHCNDSSAHAAACYAASAWDYGGAPLGSIVRHEPAFELFVLHLPFVRIVSCWK